MFLNNVYCHGAQIYRFIKSTDELLNSLIQRKLLPSKYLQKLRPSETDSELPHLYYNPKDHKIEEPLRPIVAGIKSPLSNISSFLDQILRPIFDKLTPYNLTDSIELLHDLKKFETTANTKMNQDLRQEVHESGKKRVGGKFPGSWQDFPRSPAAFTRFATGLQTLVIHTITH